MDLEQEDYSQYNQIDLECNEYDDSDSFSGMTDDTFIKPPSSPKKFVPFNNMSSSASTYNEPQPPETSYRVPEKTGIMLDFSDDGEFSMHHEPPKHMKTISADFNDGALNIRKNFVSLADQDLEAKDYNEIDMETSIGEDDDYDFTDKTGNGNINNKKISFNDNEKIFFDDDDEDFFTQLSQMEESKKSKVSYSDIEDDYWKNLKKKYEKKNKNGHNNHFHLVGDINKEMELFNNRVAGEIVNAGAPDALFAGIADTSSSESSSAAGGEAVATSESFNLENMHQNKYSNKLQRVFDIIGFDVIKNSDNSLVAIDCLDDSTPEIKAENLTGLLVKLNPYIQDCFIYPLQAQTNQKFDTCKEWVDWYQNKDIQSKYPKCKDDIEYCDVIANHLDDCVIR